MGSRRTIFLFLGILVAFLGVLGCSNSINDNQGHDSAFTVADPPGGEYWWDPIVCLYSDRTTGIYYTLNHEDPVVDDPNTYLGFSPIRGILTTHDTELKYFSVDADNEVEATHSDLYIVKPELQYQYLEWDTAWQALLKQQGEFFFPQAEGDQGEDYFQSWSLVGHLVGKSSRKEYAFVVTYQVNFQAGLNFYLRKFHVLDITSGRFVPESNIKFRIPLTDRKLIVSEDYLRLIYVQPREDLNVDVKHEWDEYDLTFDFAADSDYDLLPDPDSEAWHGGDDEDDDYDSDRWVNIESTAGALWPFHYTLAAYGKEDKELTLSLEAIKPPLFPGTKGRMKYLGMPATRVYVYPYMHLEGHLVMDGVDEDVVGEGMMERLWNEEKLTLDLVRTYRKEWLGLQLNGGYQLTLYRNWDNDNNSQADSVTMAISKPDGSVYNTPDFDLVPDNFYTVESHPPYPLSSWRWPYELPRKYYLTVPSLNLNATLYMPVPDLNTFYLVEDYQPFVRAVGSMNGERITGHGWMDISRIWK